MNQWLYSGVDYGSPLKSKRQRYINRSTWASTQAINEVVVWSTDDDVGGSTLKSRSYTYGANPNDAPWLAIIPPSIIDTTSWTKYSRVMMDVPNGKTSGWHERWPNSMDLQFYRSAATQVASGSLSLVVGSQNTASSNNTVAVGGNNTVSGSWAAAFGYWNTATATSTVSLWLSCNATVTNAVAVGNWAVSGGTNSTSIWVSTQANSTWAVAVGLSTIASWNYSFAVGATSAWWASQTNAATWSTSISGSYVSGNGGIACNIGNNTSTYWARWTSSIAIGSQAQATNTGSVAIWSSTSSTWTGAIAIWGTASFGSSTASWQSSIALWDSCNATDFWAVAIWVGATAATRGKFAFSWGFAAGTSQHWRYVLQADTVDATPKVLTTYNAAAASNNQVIVSASSAYAFSWLVVSRQKTTDGTASAAWEVKWLIIKWASAATTTLVTSSVTAISNVPGWTLALSADTTNGCLAITFTWAAATNIRTVANIQASEVVYS